MKGVMRFGKKGKLSPRYVGPYRILKRIGKVAYDIHSAIRSVAMKDSLSYEDVPIEILDRQVRRLRNKEVASIKVLWRSQSVEGATWEAEAAMKSKYPHLFPSSLSVFACRWNSVYSEIQFSVFRGQTTTRAGGPCFTTAILPCQAQKYRLSLDSRKDPRSVDQTMVRGLCLWIKTSFTQPLTQTTIDQHGPSIDPRSVGLTVDEGQQLVS
ncbi:hypothetical protein MTR67_019781 [Solanum verrucosum]|uniref:Tf2-1-like SH3-like domain-containing protein n=1 Tax=Solanum verrucosum TaxID=315347 RepID=A0AAF0QTI9_SOLVR|nr:hypothetical protein MTR67_019781 [Solanum verrucosum]